MSLFSLLGTLCAAGRRADQAAHRAHMCMVLVLTTATYRIGSQRNMPTINYLTLMDQHVLLNASVVLLAAGGGSSNGGAAVNSSGGADRAGAVRVAKNKRRHTMTASALSTSSRLRVLGVN